MKLNKQTIAIIALLIGWAWSALWYQSHRVTKEIVRVDTIMRIDTFINPVAKDSIIYMTRTVHIGGVGEPQLIHDTITDSVYLEVPITQKTYDDSTYYAVVSGFQPSLDTINIKSKTIVRTQMITDTKYKTKKFGVGISAGFDPINVKPTIVIGLNYNIFGF